MDFTQYYQEICIAIYIGINTGIYMGGGREKCNCQGYLRSWHHNIICNVCITTLPNHWLWYTPLSVVTILNPNFRSITLRSTMTRLSLYSNLYICIQPTGACQSTSYNAQITMLTLVWRGLYIPSVAHQWPQLLCHQVSSNWSQVYNYVLWRTW